MRLLNPRPLWDSTQDIKSKRYLFSRQADARACDALWDKLQWRSLKFIPDHKALLLCALLTDWFPVETKISLMGQFVARELWFNKKTKTCKNLSSGNPTLPSQVFLLFDSIWNCYAGWTITNQLFSILHRWPTIQYSKTNIQTINTAFLGTKSDKSRSVPVIQHPPIDKIEARNNFPRQLVAYRAIKRYLRVIQYLRSMQYPLAMYVFAKY